MSTTTMPRLEEFISNMRNTIQERLDFLVQEKEVSFKKLFSAARYSLLTHSKKIRPILLLATLKTLNKELKKGVDTACSLEMIHTYSLIHDDLPCMDDDDFRRGKPSLHKAYSEAHAVLAGDYLLTYSFEVIANDDHLTNEQKIALIGLLAKNAGAQGMIAGQIMDIEAEGKKIDQKMLETIHQYKTGALIAASVEMGGIIANIDKVQFEALSSYGKEIGLAFQIVDDILDVTASYEKHGKNVSSDLQNDKMTYVKLLGLEKAKQSAVSLVNSAKKHLRKICQERTLLDDLADYVVAPI